MAKDVKDCNGLSLDLNSTNSEPTNGHPVTLDVSGTIFNTTMETLSKISGSKLSELCQKNSNGTDSAFSLSTSGISHMIERDPRIFKHVLTYLRSNRTYLPT